MGGRNGSDGGLPRGIEVMAHGGELGGAFARIHVIVNVDRLEAARSFRALDGLLEVQKTVLAAASVSDVDVVVGVAGINLPLGSREPRYRRQVADRGKIGIKAGIAPVEIAQSETARARDRSLERL